MSEATIKDRNLNHNASIVSTETLMEWSKIIEDSIDSVNMDEDENYTGRISITGDMEYSGTDSNMLLGTFEDTWARKSYWVYLHLDVAGTFEIAGITFSNEEGKAFELRIEENESGEEIDSMSIQNSPYHGGEDIREGLSDIMVENFG